MVMTAKEASPPGEEWTEMDGLAADDFPDIKGEVVEVTTDRVEAERIAGRFRDAGYNVTIHEVKICVLPFLPGTRSGGKKVLMQTPLRDKVEKVYWEYVEAVKLLRRIIRDRGITSYDELGKLVDEMDMPEYLKHTIRANWEDGLPLYDPVLVFPDEGDGYVEYWVDVWLE